MKHTIPLKQNHEFRRLYSKGKSAVSPYFVVYCRRTNRVRRRIRELYRIHEADLLPGYDIVIVARTRAIYGRYSELKRSFVQQMKKLGLAAPKGDEPR